jgi:type VI secretion system protein ImpJ
VQIGLDEEALRNGMVTVQQARGVMPDGMVFHIPDADPAPPPLSVSSSFSPTAASHVLLLAIPEQRTDGANLAAEGFARARYAPEKRALRDAVTGQGEYEIEVGRKNFQLLLDNEPQEGLVSLPLARIRRDGAGHFITDPDFVPPCTKISGSSRLIELLQRALQMIEAKASALTAERDASRESVADYAAHEVANFWLLHTLRSNSSVLRHHLVTRESHPERLYVDLARLVGALSTFTLRGAPGDVPPYDHDHLTECFAELERQLRLRLEVTVPSAAIRFALEPAGNNLYGARVPDDRCYRRARWILGIRTTAPARTVITRAPELLKVCGSKFVLRLVQEARRGLELDHLPSAPSVISPRADSHYFGLTLDGPCWKAIRDARDVGVYVPDLFADATVDLHVVVDNT